MKQPHAAKKLPKKVRARIATKGKPTSREQSKEETRQALIAAAISLISERGLDASLDDICDRAGYTRGAFYVHFADRDALLATTMDMVGRRVLDVLIGVTSDDADLSSIVQRFLVALGSGAYPLTRAGGLRPYQLLDGCARSPAIRAQYIDLVQDAIKRLARRARAGQRRKTVRDDVPADQLALLITVVVIGVQTLLDLEVPLDVAAGAASLEKMWAAPKKRRRKKISD